MVLHAVWAAGQAKLCWKVWEVRGISNSFSATTDTPQLFLSRPLAL